MGSHDAQPNEFPKRTLKDARIHFPTHSMHSLQKGHVKSTINIIRRTIIISLTHRMETVCRLFHDRFNQYIDGIGIYDHNSLLVQH